MLVYPIVLALVIGVSMLGMWALLLARGQVAELNDGARAIRFHLVAETLTATLLIIGAVSLALDAAWAGTLTAAAFGAALYTTINSPGYYADRGERPFVVMFLVLALLVAGGIVVLMVL